MSIGPLGAGFGGVLVKCIYVYMYIYIYIYIYICIYIVIRGSAFGGVVCEVAAMLSGEG